MNFSLWSIVLVGIENFVLINSTFVLIAFLAIFIAKKFKLISSWHPISLSRLYSSAIVLPPIISAWLVMASLLPAVWLGVPEWSQEHLAPHNLHLLNAITFVLDPALSYAALIFVFIAAIVVLYVLVSAYTRINYIVRQLQMDSEPVSPEAVRQVETTSKKYNIEVGLIVSRYPFSFVWGFFNSKLIISTGLLNALSLEELMGLLEHEAAHHIRRDNFSKLVLTVCRYTSPAFPFTKFLYRWWSEEVELICDEIAAQRTSDPVTIAEAMVRLKRVISSLKSPTPQSITMVGSEFLDSLAYGFERRVKRLLSLGDIIDTVQIRSLSRSWIRVSMIIGASFPILLLTIFIISPLAIHRTLEIILSIL